jgi:hypothetical protein
VLYLCEVQQIWAQQTPLGEHLMPNPHQNLTHAYGRLQRDVRCTINTHADSTLRLDVQHQEVVQFVAMLNHVRVLNPNYYHKYSQQTINPAQEHISRARTSPDSA